MTRLSIAGISCIGLMGALSILTPPSRSAHAADPLLEGAKIGPPVLAILQRSCADCHSEATRYPWYSYVAPVSWLVESDVSGGRNHLNLSSWSQYPLPRKERLLSEIANQVRDRDMPLTQYLWIHHDAKLSAGDVDALFRWTQQERARLIAESQR